MTAEPDAPTVDFLGLPLLALDRSGFRTWLRTRAAAPAPTRLGYLNAHTSNLAASSPDFHRTLAAFGPSMADGQSVVWASRLLRAPVPERLNVTDLVMDVLGDLAEDGVPVALVGGRPGEAERFAEVAVGIHPSLTIVFTSSGFLEPEEEQTVMAALRTAGAKVVLMGMGSPLQEDRVRRWSAEDEVRTWWCVGAVFEYFVGTQRRAPVWMRRAGLEWLHRFAQDPRRLTGRYVIGNPRFVLRVLRARLLARTGER